MLVEVAPSPAYGVIEVTVKEEPRFTVYKSNVPLVVTDIPPKGDNLIGTGNTTTAPIHLVVEIAPVIPT
jgi:hypothetical protein